MLFVGSLQRKVVLLFSWGLYGAKKNGGSKWFIDKSFYDCGRDKMASNFALNARSGLLPNSGNLEENNVVGEMNASAQTVRYGGK